MYCIKEQVTYKFIKNFSFALFFMVFTHTYAQDYKDMMDDSRYNVYEVINAGNAYFEGKDKGKGSGYKQFQRWILQNEDLFYPSGDRSKYRPELPYLLVNSKQKQGRSKASSSSRVLVDNWTEVGPFVELKRFFDNRRDGNGRVDAIWVDPTDANRIYIGCRGGGMWTTTDGGANWSVKTDNLGITGVNSIVVNSSNVNEIYIATALAGKRSLGIFKSIDGGNTWATTGLSYQLTSNITIYKLLMSPTNPSVLFAGTSSGLLKSTDGFQTYSTVLNGNIIDIEFKPGDTSIVYASSDTNNTIYKSTNSGTSFASTGLVGVNKPQIAVSANQPNYVYMSDNSVSYRSTDSGTTFTPRGDPDGTKGQYGGFGVSDTDANLIINGSIDVYRSTDGAATFTKATDWRYNNSTGVGGNFVHADIREVEVVNGVIYIGTDGWLCKSIDGGINYEILTFNIGNQEVYPHGLGVSQTNANTLIIGTQDNGTSVLRNGVWYHWKGGDGGTSMIDDTNANIIYGSLFNGNFKRTDNGATTSALTDLGDTKPGGLPPLVKHPTNAATIFMGEVNGQVWKSTNRGASWTTIGFLGGTSTVDELVVAPSDGAYIYVSIRNRIWRTINGGTSWTELTGSLPNLVITGIAIDYNNPDTAVISYTSYTSGTKVYKTINGGTNWTNISGTLPNLPMTDVVYDSDTNNTIYISTDIGVYYRDDTMGDWSVFGTGLPNVQANDLEIQHSSSKLYVGTWGRGVWKIPLNGWVPTAPVSDFTSDITSVVEGGSVSFTDISTNTPTSWSWSFPGGTPSTSTAQNPSVTYAVAGTYDVTLTATNSIGSDVITKTGYITVVVTSDLNGHYEFDGNLLDSSNRGLHLTDSGATPYSGAYEADHNGNVSTAVITGGASSYLENTQIFPISGNANRTVTGWIKTSTLAYQGIVCLGNTPSLRKFSVAVNPTGKFRTEVSGAGLSGTTIVADGLWHHVAVTYSYDSATTNGTVKLYVDGVQDATQTNTTWGSINTDAASLIVGNEKFSLSSRGFVGALDDVRIYSKELTIGEINTVMGGGVLGLNYADDLQDKIKVYPNPFINAINIRNNTGNELNIKVYDILGNLLEADVFKNKNNITIDMNNRSSGLYFVIINTKDGTSSFKVIKR